MKGVFLVKSTISVNDCSMNNFRIFKDKTREEVEQIIVSGIEEMFENCEEIELIDSFYTQESDVSLNNFEIREISEEEAMVIERLLGSKYGFGLLSRSEFY